MTLGATSWLLPPYVPSLLLHMLASRRCAVLRDANYRSPVLKKDYEEPVNGNAKCGCLGVLKCLGTKTMSSYSHINQENIPKPFNIFQDSHKAHIL